MVLFLRILRCAGFTSRPRRRRRRRRYIRASGHVTDQNAASSEDGAVHPEASDDEAIPAEPMDIQSTLPPHFNLLLGSQDPRFTVQKIPRPVVGTPLKSPGESLDTSCHEERRTSRDPDETSWGVSLAAFGIPSWGDTHIRLDANLKGRERATKLPTLGWSSFERLHEDYVGQHFTHEWFDTRQPHKLDPNVAY